MQALFPVFGDWTAFKVHIVLRMAVLSRHKVNKRFPLVNSAPARQPAARSIDTSSVFSREDVVGCLRSPVWQQTFWIDGISARLRNFCGICGQWISSKPCALRNHVRRMHVQGSFVRMRLFLAHYAEQPLRSLWSHDLNKYSSQPDVLSLPS